MTNLYKNLPNVIMDKMKLSEVNKMEAVVYSNFRNNLKDYMKKVNDEYEPLMVVNKNPNEDIVVLSKENWDSIQETIRLMNNEYLSNKILSGMEEVKEKKHVQHQLLEVDDV